MFGRPVRSPYAYFYPRPPRGGRLQTDKSTRSSARFLSTPSARRATFRFRPGRHASSNFYPRPPRGGRQFIAQPGNREKLISIHALREEGDNGSSSRWPLSL